MGFGVPVGSPPADGWVSILVLLVWVRRPALGSAGSWIQVEVFLGVSLINTPWGQFSGSSVLDSVHPLQQLRPNFWSGNQDSTSRLLWQ